MKCHRISFAPLAVAFALAADMAAAQTASMQMPQMDASTAMMQPMQKMQQTMSALPMAGSIDRQFAALMVPHHQAAIDMAKLELARGKDPEMRRLADAIIAAQKAEIAQMNTWLAQHPR